MLKTTRSSVVSASKVDGNEVDGDRSAIGEDVISWLDASRKSAKWKSWAKSGHLGNSDNLEESKFLTSNAKEVFNYLR